MTDKLIETVSHAIWDGLRSEEIAARFRPVVDSDGSGLDNYNNMAIVAAHVVATIRKCRTVESAEELDALPFLSVIREVFWPSPVGGVDYGGIWERRTSGWQCLAASIMPPREPDPHLPSLVLWIPEDGEQ